jgi:hypothetical protein
MMPVSMWLTRFEYDDACGGGGASDPGVDGCCLTTAGASALVRRRSRSLTSSCADRSSFSALVCSATFLPRNSTDSTFLCDSISSATDSPPPLPARGVPVACTRKHRYITDAAVKRKKKHKQRTDRDASCCCTDLYADVVACPIMSERHGHGLIHLVPHQKGGGRGFSEMTRVCRNNG